MFTRRNFLSTLGRTAPAAWLAAHGRSELREIVDQLGRFTGGPDEIARDERFWAPVQQAFTVDRSIIDLNNAGVSPSPRAGAGRDEAAPRLFERGAGADHVARVLEPQRETVREGLARMLAATPSVATGR
jgi:isopenicillin-N epimerase